MGIEDGSERGAARPGVTRRTVAKAVAWSVPAIALAVPAPAFAASAAGTVSVTAQCGPGATGSFQITVSHLPAGSQIAITLSHSGNGSFTATPNFVPSSQSANTYYVTGTGSPFSGGFSILFSLGQNGQATVSATVSAVSGVALEGDLIGSITKRREGNSANYVCSTA